MITPFQVVTLMDLLEINAEPYWSCASLLGQLICRFRIVLDGRATLTDTTYGQMAQVLGEINREVQKLGLRTAIQQINRIEGYVNGSNAISNDTLYQMLVDLSTRVADELEVRPFLVLDPSYVDYYKKPQLFGENVEKRFTRMSEDIAEAGKCLALNQSTASVFHLMRVMEIAVQEFGTAVGVSLTAETVWQVILDQINKSIKAMDPKHTKTKQYAEAASHLYNVKLAWRNEVMHPKQTYTPDEAKKIFDNVGTFINDLVGIV